MKKYLFLLVMAASQSLWALDLEDGKACIMALAGNHPELRACRGRAVAAQAAEGEPAEFCSSTKGKLGKPCSVYVSCPSEEGGSRQRYRIEAEVLYRGWAALIGLDCQLYNITPHALD